MGKHEWNSYLQRWLDETVEKVKEDKNLDHWEELYRKVFSDEVSRKIREEFPRFDWYDPDADYEDDVRSFINSFNDFAGGSRDA